MTDHDHCWHLHKHLLSLPPKEEQICCWCGLIQIIPEYLANEQPHGDYIPTHGKAKQ